jgi:hypothetical protein
VRRFVFPLLCLVGLGFGGVLTVALRRSSPPQVDSVPAMKSLPDTGVQEVAVFIGASWCRASAFPQLRDSLPLLMKVLETEAHARNHRFSSIGVSLDAVPKDGIAWLSNYGTFRELIVGGGWGNYGVIGLIWSDPASSPELPQLLIMTRPILASAPRMRFGSVTVRERLYGMRHILQRFSSHPAQTGFDSAGKTIQIGA